jgi:hypothetical protein
VNSFQYDFIYDCTDLILYSFYVLHDTLLVLTSCQTFRNVKYSFHSPRVQKEIVGKIWFMISVCQLLI